MEKRKYNVYRVREYTDGFGTVTRTREFVGHTFAVSAAKARVNMEYRLRGKAIYGGSNVYEMGCDTAMEVFYEAEEAV